MSKRSKKFDSISAEKPLGSLSVSADEKIRESSEEILAECLGRFFISKRADVSERLSARVSQWRKNVSNGIIKECPFGADEKELEEAEEKTHKNEATIVAIEKSLASYRRFATRTGKIIDGDKEYWQETFAELRKKETEKASSIFGQAEVKKQQNKVTSRFSIFQKLIRQGGNKRSVEKQDSSFKAQSQAAKKIKISKEEFYRLLLKKWREALEQARVEWEIEQINKWRCELMKKLENWLWLLQEIQKTIRQLGLDTGMLFDLSKGGLSLDDLKQLKHWAEIANTPDVRKLCDMLGRLRRAAQIKQLERVTNISSKEEIVGVCLGRDIERALPQEKMLLADDDTALLFELKYVENRLLCFDMHGWQDSEGQVSEDGRMGPIIICVDTSGSMQGEPAKIAKAIAMFMSTRAMAQKRRCYLINFSTIIETLDLSFDKGMSDLLSFLRRSFNGGTDPLPAIEAGVAMMQKEGYQKSDLLMVSDFVVSKEISQGLKEKIAKARKEKNRFYALAIPPKSQVGAFYAEQTLQEGVFDGEWSYEPRRGDIRKLAEIVVDGIAEQ